MAQFQTVATGGTFEAECAIGNSRGAAARRTVGAARARFGNTPDLRNGDWRFG